MNKKKILVAYFSHTGENYAVGNISQGNTQIVAEIIADITGGDLFRIEPISPYPDGYTECIEVAKAEKVSSVRPVINSDTNVEGYDMIFIGYPNWWGDMPMTVYTFIEKHDWTGKTVIPFCTHEGSGLSATERKLKDACKGAVVMKGLAVRGTNAQNSRTQTRQAVEKWLERDIMTE